LLPSPDAGPRNPGGAFPKRGEKVQKGDPLGMGDHAAKLGTGHRKPRQVAWA